MPTSDDKPQCPDCKHRMEKHSRPNRKQRYQCTNSNCRRTVDDDSMFNLRGSRIDLDLLCQFLWDYSLVAKRPSYAIERDWYQITVLDVKWKAETITKRLRWADEHKDEVNEHIPFFVEGIVDDFGLGPLTASFVADVIWATVKAHLVLYGKKRPPHEQRSVRGQLTERGDRLRGDFDDESGHLEFILIVNEYSKEAGW